MLLGLCLLSGVSYLAGARAPTSVEAVMPDWLVAAWKVALVIAGLVGIVGNLWPGDLGTALLVRLSGQLLASGPGAAFSIAAFAYAGQPALFAGGLVAAWAVACLWTARHLAQDLRAIRGLP